MGLAGREKGGASQLGASQPGPNRQTWRKQGEASKRQTGHRLIKVVILTFKNLARNKPKLRLSIHN